MLKTRLLIGVVAAAFAVSVTADVASAATMHKHHAAPKVAAVTFDSGPPASLKCGKGQVPILHSSNPMKLKWGCVKAA
jgi:hypothetical protein